MIVGTVKWTVGVASLRFRPLEGGFFNALNMLRKDGGRDRD
jgi:hypothetical protein